MTDKRNFLHLHSIFKRLKTPLIPQDDPVFEVSPKISRPNETPIQAPHCTVWVSTINWEENRKRKLKSLYPSNGIVKINTMDAKPTKPK